MSLFPLPKKSTQLIQNGGRKVLLFWHMTFLKKTPCLMSSCPSYQKPNKLLQLKEVYTNVFKMEREVFHSCIWWEYFWRMKFLKNCIDVVFFPAISVTKINWVHTNVFKMAVLLSLDTHEKFCLLYIKHFYRRWCFFLWWRGLLYSIDGGAERAHRLYQYFLRGCER